jgi:hypothetical protein
MKIFNKRITYGRVDIKYKITFLYLLGFGFSIKRWINIHTNHHCVSMSLYLPFCIIERIEKLHDFELD